MCDILSLVSYCYNISQKEGSGPMTQLKLTKTFGQVFFGLVTYFTVALISNVLHLEMVNIGESLKKSAQW